MKKIISLIFLLFLVGCSKEKIITCNVEVNNKTDNYTMTGTYKIYYEDSYVKFIEEKEKYISPNEDVLIYFEESKKLEYYNLNDLYNGYSYKIEKDENSIGISSSIDMSKVNIKQMIKDKKIDKDYVISNRLTTGGIVRIYESIGAVCDI